MYIGEIIDHVRKQKGLTIKQICGEKISRTTYHRFVKEQSDTSIGNLTYLLQKVNLYYDELKTFDYPENVNWINQIMKEIKQAFFAKDIDELKRIQAFRSEQTIEIAEQQTKRVHMASLCDLLIAKLENKKFNVTCTEIYSYLINAQTWTRYELVLFNNCMYAFHAEFLESVLEKAVRGIGHYRGTGEGKSEGFRMLANAVIHFIQMHNLNSAWKYLEKMNNYPLSEEMFFEKSLKLIINGIWECLRRNTKGNEKIKQGLQVFKSLEAKNHYKMNVELIRFIEKRYGIEFDIVLDNHE